MEPSGTRFQRLFVRQQATFQDTMDKPHEDQPNFLLRSSFFVLHFPFPVSPLLFFVFLVVVLLAAFDDLGLLHLFLFLEHVFLFLLHLRD